MKLQIKILMHINQATGHLPGCFNDGHTGTIRPIAQRKPMCSEVTATGVQCSGIATRYGCVTRDAHGVHRGFCNNHWTSHPDHNDEWDADVSACANRIADHLEFSLTQRKQINQYNIQEMLGIPSWSVESHLSLQRTKGAVNANKRQANQTALQQGKLRETKALEKLRQVFQNQIARGRQTEEEISMEDSSLDSYEEDSFVEKDEDESDDDASFESSDESVVIVHRPLKRLKRKADIDRNKRPNKKPKY